MSTTPADLVVDNLTVSYGGVVAVRGISFGVRSGESIGIIGANGAGKTSTLKAVLGLVKRQVGRLSFGETDLTAIPARAVIRQAVGYVPEGRHIFSGLTVEKNLMMGGYIRRWDRTLRPRLNEVYDIFPVLQEMRGRLAGALSGGQQQMLAIGRALITEPKLLVLDEPSMGLSPRLVDDVLAVIRRLNERGLGILLVEQNAKLTFEATQHCFVMENGRIVMAGDSEDLRDDAQVRRIYLGI